MPDTFGDFEPDESAKVLLEMDKQIQNWIKAIDKKLEDLIGKLPERNVKQPDLSCEVKSGALPVNTALKAVHFGTLKVIFRVLPRALENFLVAQFQKVIEKIATKFAAHKILGVFPLLDAAVSIAVGTATTLDYMDDLEDSIHSVLGCKPGDHDASPMRCQLNEIIKEVKKRGKLEHRPKKQVATRHHTPLPKKPRKSKKKKKGKSGEGKTTSITAPTSYSR